MSIYQSSIGTRGDIADYVSMHLARKFPGAFKLGIPFDTREQHRPTHLDAPWT